jgi:hypothetical protein
MTLFHIFKLWSQQPLNLLAQNLKSLYKSIARMIRMF